MKPKYSSKDSCGRLLVACCECNRGGNGDQSCTAGWSSKRWDHKACFNGELLGKYDPDKIRG